MAESARGASRRAGATRPMAPPDPRPAGRAGETPPARETPPRRRQRAHAAARVRTQRTDGKEAARDGDTEAAVGIARDDRPGHRDHAAAYLRKTLRSTSTPRPGRDGTLTTPRSQSVGCDTRL